MNYEMMALCADMDALPRRNTAVSACRSVDAVAKEPGDGTPTTDFEALYAGLSGNCKY
jgi:hypothetical protein